ncbi:MAG TPA: membrane protein insertase YidC [bacterium]|nr:membrane protein insertase YidC [bacterium]
MNESKRLITFIVLSGIILFGFNLIFPPSKSGKPSRQESPVSSSPAPAKTEAASPSSDRLKTSAPAQKTQEIRTIEEKLVAVETGLYTATFATIGATLKSFALKAYTDSFDKKSGDPIELIPNKASYTYLAFSIPGYDLENSAWDFTGRTEKDGETKLVFSSRIRQGVTAERTYTLRDDSYLISSDIKIINNSGVPAVFKDMAYSWGPNIHRLPADTLREKVGFFHYNRVYYPVLKNKSKHKEINLKIQEERITTLAEKPEWVVFKDMYFVTSFLFNALTDYKEIQIKETPGGFAFLTVNLKDVLIEPGASESFKIDSYIGPQEYKKLKKHGMQAAIDLGWIKFLGVWMFYGMDFLYSITNNYGVAIILLTILIRGLLWYPSQKSYKHMKETQKKMNVIKPRMETLKKIYKDDSKKMNEEMMKLYQEYKINPFGGCLPMLLQLPIFIALYQTLVSMVELKGASFAFWLKDLSIPDPLYILPFFMGTTMFIQTKMSQTMSPSPEAETQQKILLFGMPIFLTFLSFNWPSGLLLYWSVSNLLGILQQFFVNKSK